ncbi:hypothetical protein [Haladaptatus sp. DJG-WS-42]|uniref:hypothetical protein n=1 Tax=Haladaptatus sp. DJG-WS-42 TaxID=3120516 RepID=UPI0030CB8402
MQTDAGTDRLLRLVVGTLLLAVATATYTEQLSVTLSLFCTVVLVSAVLVSALSRHLSVSPPTVFRPRQYRHWRRTDELHPVDHESN